MGKPALVCLSMLLVTGLVVAEESPTMEEMRADLSNLYVLRDYVPHKNAFILGHEWQSQLPPMLNPGDRKTLLYAEGRGSLRHIWETHRRQDDATGEVPYLLEFFVDGEETPSIRGTIGNLVAAAARARQPFFAVGGRVVRRNSMNFYLPVPFERSLRVDYVCTEPVRFVFSQWDWRLGDTSLRGIRLRQRGEGDTMELYYEGRLPRRNEAAPRVRRLIQRFVGDGTVEIEGPAIVRRLAFNARRSGVRLRIRYDGEESFAVDADLSDFLGPFRGAAFNNNACYLPMPFRRSVEISLTGSGPFEEWQIEVDRESVHEIGDDWGYFHARSRSMRETNGYELYPVLYTRGRGQWLSMNLYASGHDHGGGDFAVVDGETTAPAFLKGINGEDYFNFAWFGRGENLPYSEAFDNDTGRMRLHLANPYVFRDSFALSWATLAGASPRSVAYWYQSTPVDLTLRADGPRGLVWSVFGPVDVPLREDGNTPDTSSARVLFASLPSPEALDAGGNFPVRQHMSRRNPLGGAFTTWATQTAVGPMLDLTYIYRRVQQLGSSGFLDYKPRAMLARTVFSSSEEDEVTLQLSCDDPIVVEWNGEVIHESLELGHGFTTVGIPVRLRVGENVLLVQLADTPNENDMWAALCLRVLDDAGSDVSGRLQPR